MKDRVNKTSIIITYMVLAMVLPFLLLLIIDILTK